MTVTVKFVGGILSTVSLGLMLGGCPSGGDPTSAAASSAASTSTSSGSTSPATANVESVTLSWTAPAFNANGTPANNLAGYHIYYGTSEKSLNSVITVENPGDTSQVIGNLSTGTWYFAVASFNTEKVESALSAVLPVSI